MYVHMYMYIPFEDTYDKYCDFVVYNIILHIQSRVSWVRVPPEAAHFSRKSDCLGCAVLLCLVCLFDLACFFLSSFSSLI